MHYFWLFEFLLLVSFIASYLDWRKKKTPLSAHFIRLCGVGMAEVLCQGLIVDILHVSGVVSRINYYANLIFWTILFIIAIVLWIKALKKNEWPSVSHNQNKKSLTNN